MKQGGGGEMVVLKDKGGGGQSPTGKCIKKGLKYFSAIFLKLVIKYGPECLWFS